MHIVFPGSYGKFFGGFLIIPGKFFWYATNHKVRHHLLLLLHTICQEDLLKRGHDLNNKLFAHFFLFFQFSLTCFVAFPKHFLCQCLRRHLYVCVHVCVHVHFQSTVWPGITIFHGHLCKVPVIVALFLLPTQKGLLLHFFLYCSFLFPPMILCLGSFQVYLFLKAASNRSFSVIFQELPQSPSPSFNVNFN